MKNINWTILLAGFMLLLSLNSCEEEKIESPEKQAVKSLYNLMQSWYLWYDEVPQIELSNYNTPEEVLEAVRYKKDQWSYITTVEKLNNYYNKAAFTGYGFGYGTDTAGNVRITFTFEESPLRDYGVKRSWILESIDGEKIGSGSDVSNLLGSTDAGQTNEFTIISPSKQDTIKQTFTSQEMTRNTVLHSSTINTSAGKTGYMVLHNFLGTTSGEILNVFQTFSNENIENIVIDLRYNTGGLLTGASEMANYLISDDHIGDVFMKLLYNDQKEAENTFYKFKQDSLSLNWSFSEIYFITTGVTASASEALINGLKPYTTVHTIGQQTYGKPVGMRGFTDQEEYYAFMPVCFRVANNKDETNYFDGLPVDVQEHDDVTHMFGDTREACLEQAINHIENGSFLKRKTIHDIRQPKVGPYYRKEMIIFSSKQSK